MIIKASPGHPLLLGRLGENLAREIVFVDEVAAWLNEYPNAAIGLLNQRPGDTQGYPVARAVVSGGALHWTVTNTDLSAWGNGRCELIATDNGVVVKSAIYDTIILTALDGSGETPEPWEDWREYFVELKDEAEGSAEAAASSATAAGQSATQAGQSAEDAATSAAAAQESAEAIQDMGVESETLPPGSPLNVEKTIDPETGAVTLTFYLAPGQDGISPTIAVTEITGGHRVTITDAQGTRSFDVLDGTNGEDGRGIASAVMNADYTLTLTYTDGTSYTTPSLRGAPGVGVPAGGTAGQVLKKKTSGTDYDTEWGNEPTVPVQDVQVNGASILDAQGVANVPAAGTGVFGAVRLGGTNTGIELNNSGSLRVSAATPNAVKLATSVFNPITPSTEHAAAFYGLAKAASSDMSSLQSTTIGVYPEAQKSAISQMLNGSVIVTGSTPSITALPGIRYVCGEVATLDITLPASGIVDVVFESGATATVLTITPPTGVTLKWANGFDPASLEANTIYEIRVRNGHLASALAWA